ncbi:TPA: DUF551 domain-containing protein [Enterobacter ludwigii]
MSNIDKQAVQAVADLKAGYTLGHADVAILNELARIALASLEAEAVAYIRAAHNPDGFCFADGIHPAHRHQKLPLSTLQDGCYWTVTPLYTAPPAPVSVPDFTVLDRLAGEMLTHAMNCERRVSVAYTHCAHRLAEEVMGLRAAMFQGADGNSPVVPDGWVACSERMPDIGTEIFYFCQGDGLRDCGIVSSSNFSGRGDAQLYVHAEGYDLRFGVDITHWMPLPAAPQHEVK